MRNVLLACLGVLLALSAVAAPEPYVIGAVFDITGPASPLGTPERDTAQMLVDQLNARGGIKGHPVKLIIYDNASDEAKSVTAIKKLIEDDKVLAIIGPSQTGTTLAAAETVQAAKVPMISCAAGTGRDAGNLDTPSSPVSAVSTYRFKRLGGEAATHPTSMRDTTSGTDQLLPRLIIPSLP